MTENNQNQNPAGAPTPEHKEKNTGMAIVAYLLFFVPLLTDAKNDPFVRYHVNQGFILFLASVVAMILSTFPPIMWVSWILHLGILVLFIMGIMNVLGGKQVPLPLIGQFASHIKI